MVHCGYEPTAVNETFNSWRGLIQTARLTLFGPKRIPAEELAAMAQFDAVEAAADEASPAEAPREFVELPILTR